jgi:hypothetical protein
LNSIDTNINICNNNIELTLSIGRVIQIGGNGLETSNINISNNVINAKEVPAGGNTSAIVLGFYSGRQGIRNANVSNNTMLFTNNTANSTGILYGGVLSIGAGGAGVATTFTGSLKFPMSREIRAIGVESVV